MKLLQPTCSAAGWHTAVGASAMAACGRSCGRVHTRGCLFGCELAGCMSACMLTWVCALGQLLGNMQRNLVWSALFNPKEYAPVRIPPFTWACAQLDRCLLVPHGCCVCIDWGCQHAR
jgi:hypothetical protein